MKTLSTAVVLVMFVTAAMAQQQGQSADLLDAAQAERSLSMFVTAVQASGMAKMLKEGGPFTVFAPSDRAFIGLAKEDRATLFADPAAMRMLLSRYIVRRTAGSDPANLSSLRTLVGLKLLTDVHEGARYVNGAVLPPTEIVCANGTIRVLDHLDPILVQHAVISATGK